MYKFIKEPRNDQFDCTRIEHTVLDDDISLDSSEVCLLTAIESFLRACGYEFEGHLVIRDDDNG
jgi:hypothetical protein